MREGVVWDFQVSGVYIWKSLLAPDRVLKEGQVSGAKIKSFKYSDVVLWVELCPPEKKIRWSSTESQNVNLFKDTSL